jgi:hypothetical protein
LVPEKKERQTRKRQDPKTRRGFSGARHLCCRNDRPKPIQGLVLDPATSHALQDESCAPTHASRSAAFMLQNTRPHPVHGLILDPATSNALQDESCAPTHASRSAAFMLQNTRPHPIQGLILDQATSNALQDESCAPTHARGARHFCCRNDRPKPIQGFVLDPATSHARAFALFRVIGPGRDPTPRDKSEWGNPAIPGRQSGHPGRLPLRCQPPTNESNRASIPADN